MLFSHEADLAFLQISPEAACPRLDPLSGVFNYLAYKHSTSHHTLHLFRQRLFDVVIVVCLSRQIDIDSRTLTRENLGSQRIFAQINGRAVDLVQHDSRQCTQYLHFKLRTLDDIDGTNKRIYDKRALSAIIKRDSISLSDNTDGSSGAARYKDGVRDGSLDLDHLPWIIETFDEPFVPLKVFSWLLFGAHAFRLRFLAWYG